MNLKQWAERQGVSYATARRWFAAGTLPVQARRVGGLSAGVAIAAAIWRYIPRDVLTAKIFHDPRDRSPFASRLPVRQD